MSTTPTPNTTTTDSLTEEDRVSAVTFNIEMRFTGPVSPQQAREILHQMIVTTIEDYGDHPNREIDGYDGPFIEPNPLARSSFTPHEMTWA